MQKKIHTLFMQWFEIKTEFMQPLYLPCQVNILFQSYESDTIHDELHFKVKGLKANHPQ